MKAVLLLCVLVFLNFPVTCSSIFGCLCCGKEQEKNAVQIFLGEGTEAITLDISMDCWLMPQYEEFSKWVGIKKNGDEYEIKTGSDIIADTIGIRVTPLKDSCRVGLDKSKNNVINVIPISELPKNFKECPSNGEGKLQFQSSFLLFIENMNTFMFLDPNKARWFFTSELGGCDIFVATDPNKPDKPLVIHSNFNLKKHDDKANLEHKSDTVDMIMKFVPEAEGYKLRARVYHKSESPDAREYMVTYQKTHPQIKEKNIVIYDTALLNSEYYFFGYYTTDSEWHFFIRARKGGETYFVL